jgi:hypothetical protein
LDINSNNFPEQDLSIFSRFINLKKLYIDNVNEEKIKKGVYNHFKGGLEFLKSLAKLETLVISNTDIDSGLEHLPDNLKNFSCSTDYRKDAKCQNIYNLFADENGKVETETDKNGNKCIINFPQKLQAYKQKPQVKAEVEQTLTAEQITAEQLNQQLAKHNYLTGFANT